MNKSSKTTRFIVLSVLFHILTFLGFKIYKGLNLQHPEVNSEKTQELEIEINTSRDELSASTHSLMSVSQTSNESTTSNNSLSNNSVPFLNSVIKSSTPTDSKLSSSSGIKSEANSSIESTQVISSKNESIRPKVHFKNPSPSRPSVPALTALKSESPIENQALSEPTSEPTDPVVHVNHEEVPNEELIKEELAKTQAAQEVSNKIEADKIATVQKEEALKNELSKENAIKPDPAKAAEEARIQKEQGEIEKRLKMRKEEEAKLAAASPEITSSEKATPYPTNSDDIKSMGELKALPNNPLPKYTKEERLRGDKGTVVFHAFISSEGIPTEFKMIESTGHKNLDEKSLNTLKQWKFSPGQEGWAELSFKWNLEGKPETLNRNTRTAGSRSLNE